MGRFSTVLAIACLFCAVIGHASDRTDARDEPPALSAEDRLAVELKAPLSGARDWVQIVRADNGKPQVIVTTRGGDEERLMTADDFLILLYEQGSRKNWITRILNVSSYAGIAWVVLGFLGQAVFAGRMLVQWLVSESEGRSVIPVSFWWMSLTGSTMLLVYFIWRRDIVGVLGQTTGWVIYLRNLLLIQRARNGLPTFTNRTTRTGK